MAANKLTPDDATELRYFWALGAKPMDLARAYHISPEAAYAHTTYRAKREAYRKAYYASESEHVKAQRREWQQSPNGKLSKRKDWLKRAYSMTVADKHALFMSQNGRCAILGEPLELFRAHVDHDHVTGKVRGLLCARCNTRLVGLEHKEYYSKAQAYLTRHA